MNNQAGVKDLRTRAKGVDVNGHRSVVATEPIRAGEVIYHLSGDEIPTANRYSIQVGRTTHVMIPEDLSAEEIMCRHFWIYTNHSCDPAAAVVEREMVALRDLQAGEQVTFDYDTTEYELFEPFACHCGAPRCRQVIRGFRYMDNAARKRLRGRLADHLLMMDDESDRVAELPSVGDPAFAR